MPLGGRRINHQPCRELKQIEWNRVESRMAALMIAIDVAGPHTRTQSDPSHVIHIHHLNSHTHMSTYPHKSSMVPLSRLLLRYTPTRSTNAWNGRAQLLKVDGERITVLGRKQCVSAAT